MKPKSDLVVHALSADPSARATLLAMQECLHMTVRVSDSVIRTQVEFPTQRPDVLVIDADIGIQAVVETIHHVRNELFNDWLPIILLSSGTGARYAIEEQAPWTIDFHVAKPLSATALEEHQVALRRMVALRRVSRSALDRVSEAVIVIDASGTIRSFNGAAEGLFGWTAQEAVGANVTLLMPSEHGDKHPEYLNNYEKTRHANIIGVGRVL